MLLSLQLARMERFSDNLAIYSALRIWRGKLYYVKDMLTHVLPFERRRDKLSLLRCFGTWKWRADLINGERIVTRIVDRRRLGSSCNIWSQAALVVSFRHSVFGFLISIVDADRSALVRNGSNANTCSNPASPSGVTTTTVSRCDSHSRDIHFQPAHVAFMAGAK